MCSVQSELEKDVLGVLTVGVEDSTKVASESLTTEELVGSWTSNPPQKQSGQRDQ